MSNRRRRPGVASWLVPLEPLARFIGLIPEDPARFA